MQINMLKALFIVVLCLFFFGVNLYNMVWCKSQKLVVSQQKQTREEIKTFYSSRRDNAMSNNNFINNRFFPKVVMKILSIMISHISS